jgi:hypothetical protein
MSRMLAVMSAALLVGATSLPAWACGEKNVSAAGQSIVVAQASAETTQEEPQGEAQAQSGTEPEAQSSPQPEAQPSEGGETSEQGNADENM